MSGTVFKKISAFGNASGNYEFIGDYFVRSDVNGRGYLYIPGSGDEWLTGDVSAQAGDTVHDVLVAIWDPPVFSVVFRDFVVDSVVVLSNAGVSVTRHYLDPTPLHPFNPFNPNDPGEVFWQAGMGTAFGPFVIGSSGFYQCIVNDTMQYDASNSGLPGPGGFGQICWPLTMGTQEIPLQDSTRMKISPNPAEDDLVIQLAGQDAHLGGRLALIDPSGRIVLATDMGGPLKQIDVATFQGFYTVVLESSAGRFIGRVVIQ